MCNHHETALNSAPADPVHDQEHSRWSRRTFLRNLGITGGAGFMLSQLPVTAYGSSPLAFALTSGHTDRILVMVRLKGGNDGLNTVVPVFDYSRYRALRPSIALPENQLVRISPELGLHPSLSPLSAMWQDGSMKLLNNVGYPEQNLSHFRSADIWASASDEDVVLDTGFMGRFFQDQYPDFIISPPAIPPAVQIGGLGNLAFIGDENINYAVSMASPEQLEYIARAGSLHDTENLPDCLYGTQLGYIRTIANNTFHYASTISQAYGRGANTVSYSGSLGQQLSIVARLIKGNLGTRLYMVTLDGFDTHAGQLDDHARLMKGLADNMSAFYDDLSADGQDGQVLSFTFSEFGRRPQQNASQGTDHGAAAPMFMFGPALNGNGISGSLPDLHDLDENGNLRHRVDFRSIYATLLDYWLCIDPALVDLVMGSAFTRINLGFSCTSTSLYEASYMPVLRHEVRHERDGLPYLYIQPPGPGRCRVALFNAMGQPLAVLSDEYRLAEPFLLPVPGSYTTIPGYYFYRIEYGNRVYSGKVLCR